MELYMMSVKAVTFLTTSRFGVTAGNVPAGYVVAHVCVCIHVVCMHMSMCVCV